MQDQLYMRCTVSESNLNKKEGRSTVPTGSKLRH